MISLIVVLVIIGLVLFCVNTYLPLDPKIKKILNIAVVVATVLWLCYVFGVLPIGGHDIEIPKIK